MQVTEVRRTQGVLLSDNRNGSWRKPRISKWELSSPFPKSSTVQRRLKGLRAILAQYKRESVLLVLAKLSAALRLWFRPDYEKDNGLARDVFKDAARADAHTMPGRPRRLFFTRLGVLVTARQALIACSNANARGIEQPAAAAQILACCLMMNELTASSAW
jgi:hypothetical protein